MATVGSPIPVHLPPYLPDKQKHRYQPRFDIWVVILTGVAFFTVLTWYTFLLQFYRYVIGYNSDSPKATRRILRRNAIAAFGFAVIWTTVLVAMYLYMRTARIISTKSNRRGQYKLGHPILPEEVSIK